jgi:hypothetical protein
VNPARTVKVKLCPRLASFMDKCALVDGKTKGEVVEEGLLLLVAVRTVLPPPMVDLLRSITRELASSLDEDGD